MACRQHGSEPAPLGDGGGPSQRQERGAPGALRMRSLSLADARLILR